MTAARKLDDLPPDVPCVDCGHALGEHRNGRCWHRDPVRRSAPALDFAEQAQADSGPVWSAEACHCRGPR